MNILKLVISFFLATASSVALAGPIFWSVEDMTLTDGSTLAGGFEYDVSTDTVSNLNITLSPASGTPASYSLLNEIFSFVGADRFFFTETAAADYTGQATLWLDLETGLTDAGGRVADDTGTNWGWGICSNSGCNPASTIGALRGSLVSVPEPSVLALLGLGIFGIGVARTKLRKG